MVVLAPKLVATDADGSRRVPILASRRLEPARHPPPSVESHAHRGLNEHYHRTTTCYKARHYYIVYPLATCILRRGALGPTFAHVLGAPSQPALVAGYLECYIPCPRYMLNQLRSYTLLPE